MKHAVFVLVLIVLAFILLKLLFWTLKHVIAIAVIAAIVYFVVQYFSGKKRTS